MALHTGLEKYDRLINYHWTMLDGNVAYSGLHKKIKGAQKAKVKNMSSEIGNRATRWAKMPIVELKKGQRFILFGSGGKKVVHGENDGTHGSLADSQHTLFLLRKA